MQANQALRSRPRAAARQRGGMISLLLVLLVIGLLAYFALHSYGGSTPATAGGASAPAQVQCTQRITALVQATGGLGPAYASGYAALPPECQKFAPPPAAVAAPPDADH